MNDFFSVLDDFEFEEFSAGEGSGYVSSFTSFDTVGDSSAPVEPSINEVKTDKSEITQEDVDQGKNYVWKNDNNPFDGTTAGVYLTFKDGLTASTDGGENGDLPYYEVELKDVQGLTFTRDVADTAPLQIGEDGVAAAGTEGLQLTLNKGNITGGVIKDGTGSAYLFSNFTANGDTLYEHDATSIDADGFDADVQFEASNNDIKFITTPEGSDGTITVTGDYKFDLNDEAVQVKGVNTEAAGALVFNIEDGEVKVDANALTAAENSTIEFKSVAGATELIPPAAVDTVDTVKIGSKTYHYNTNGNAYFMLDNAKATGFVLVDNGDNIWVENDADIKVYDEDDTSKALVNVDGKNYGVFKAGADSFGVQIVETASVSFEDTDTELDFTVSKATKTNLEGEAPFQVIFDSEGNVESVNGIERFSTGDKLVVEGAVATSDGEGIRLVDVDGNETGYISVDDGAFTYEYADGKPQITVAAGATVYDAANESNLFVGTTGGSVTDGDNKTYQYSGAGHFVVENDVISSFAFAKAGDEIIGLSTGDDQLPLIDADGNAIEVPAVEGDDAVSVKFDGTNYVISDLTAGAVVTDTEGQTFTAQTGSKFIFDNTGDIIGFDNYSGAIELTEAQSGVTINGETLTFNFADDAQTITAYTDGTDIVSVTGLNAGDTISTTDTDPNGTLFVFKTTGGTDEFTVGETEFTVTNDDNERLVIDGSGAIVDDLDANASLTLSEAKAVTVNGKDFTADELSVAGAEIKGYDKRVNGENTLSAFISDATHPIIDGTTTPAELLDFLGIPARDFILETEAGTQDLSTVEGAKSYLFNEDAGVHSVIFNNAGKNLAVVDEGVTGDKTIKLGNKGDAVIVDSNDVDGSVNITGGTGNDTIIVRGNLEENDVVYKGSMPTTIDLSQGGADKVITYAAANANIALKNYNATLQPGAGIVFHDPQMPYIKKDLVDAIQDGLLTFEDTSIIAIDRGETSTGIDQKTQISVENSDSKYQTMVRLFGYKDDADGYSDDYGQLVGFTGTLGGTLDASDIAEDLVLIGNKDGNKAGSNLKTGAGSDTVFAGGKDTVDTGDGVDTVIMQNDAYRDAATIVVGRGAGDAVQNLKSGFNGDIFDVTSFDGKLEYAYADGNLTIVDKSSESALTAAPIAETVEQTGAIKQRFINGTDTLYAAIAEEGGIITVTDSDDTVPNYYLAKDGAINFSQFSGDVGIDVDGEDLDYPSAINGTSVSIGSSVSSLIGGTGTTIFKGGKGDEVLVAGTGESSLYGGGGKNLLVGSTGTDKVESTEFFNIGIHNGAQNSITNFEFIADGGTNQATFDNMNLGLADGNEVTDVQANSDGSVSIAIKGGETGATERVTIAGAAGKEFLIDRGTQTETVAQIAASEVTVNNDYVDFYAATNDSTGATVKVGNIASTEIWLAGPPVDHDKKVADFTSSKFTVIDASGSSAEVIMAGNELANTIYGGAGTASMWGGEGSASDVMVGGTGHNEYYYEVGNGNDTILSAKDGDIVHLGMTLDQINFDGTAIGANGIVVQFNDGGTLNIDGGAEVTFSFDDGTNVKANRQNGQFE